MITLDYMIQKLTALRDEHGNLPIVHYPEISFEPVRYFDPTPVRLETTKYSSFEHLTFVSYDGEPTHVEI